MHDAVYMLGGTLEAVYNGEKINIGNGYWSAAVITTIANVHLMNMHFKNRARE